MPKGSVIKSFMMVSRNRYRPFHPPFAITLYVQNGISLYSGSILFSLTMTVTEMIKNTYVINAASKTRLVFFPFFTKKITEKRMIEKI